LNGWSVRVTNPAGSCGHAVDSGGPSTDGPQAAMTRANTTSSFLITVFEQHFPDRAR
jgi:hypothetical protein